MTMQQPEPSGLRETLHVPVSARNLTVPIAVQSGHRVASEAEITTNKAEAISLSGPNPRSFWSTFGFEGIVENERGLSGILPPNVICFSAEIAQHDQLVATVKKLGAPGLVMQAGGRKHYFFSSSPAAILPEPALPDRVQLLAAGDRVDLATGLAFTPETYRFKRAGDMPMAELSQGCADSGLPPSPEVETPLAAFTLRGRALQFEENVVPAVAILGELCLAGQATVWYAAPNAGKTLIGLKLVAEAVAAQRVTAGNVYYINADDGSEGFATKLRILDDLGVHTLAPGFRGFLATDLSEHLREMAACNAAHGVLVIIDTAKKFVDLMHKKEASAFGDACRQFVLKGGTLLALAHTNKNAGANGKANYAGVADIVQDFDAAYLMEALGDVGDSKERVVQFEAFKRRGDGIGKVAYAYAIEDGISYHERLASVRKVDPKLFEEFERYQAEKTDSAVIDAICQCIGEGTVQKMALARAAAAKAHVSERSAVRVLEAYTGPDPDKHRWVYRVRERGAKVFELLNRDSTNQLSEAA